MEQNEQKILINMGSQSNGFGDVVGHSFFKYSIVISYLYLLFHCKNKKNSF